MMRLSERAEFLVDNLDLQKASGVDDARWEYFQLAHLSDDSTFGIEAKSRQIAWSFLIAAEAVANAILNKTSSMFQSMNQDEAKEKIVYAERVYESLRVGGLPKVTNDNQLTLAFDNGARIISSPGTPQRGKARFWVYLDEWAHQKHDRENYTASLPIISKGGAFRGGSSPLGASGVFWEIFKEKLRPYPGFTRKSTPWWEIYAFCVNVREARKLAPNMPTAHRVELFGNDRIKAIYANMSEEDFGQEYECLFSDESVSWITWDEIRNAQDDGLIWEKARCTGKAVGAAYDAINRLAAHIAAGRIERVLVAGMDIGRTRDATELYFVGLGANSYPLRLAIELSTMPFDEQQAVINYALMSLPVLLLMIDQTGIGRNLAENAHKQHGAKVRGVDFTNESKLLWATDAKTLIQKGKTPLPHDRDLAYQIHSIRRMVTGSNNLVFDTDKAEKHHADKFWAWALGLAAVRQVRYMQQSTGAQSSSEQNYY